MPKSETPMKSDKAGLGEVLAQPESGKAEVDIIFVHGLGGHRLDTWTWEGNGEKTFWPQDLLPKDCPTARILSFGYNADWAKFYPEAETVAPELTIDNYSIELVEALKVLRGDADAKRPIIFVAHSMGGLVVANALSRSHKGDEAGQNIADRTIGVLFLGTPFEGSSKAKYAKIALELVKHVLRLPTQPTSVHDLEERSRKLTDINRAFGKYLEDRNRARDKPFLELACFFEERPMSRQIGFIVPQESATWVGKDPQSIQAHHTDMCKFQDEYGSDYKKVAGRLSQWVKDIEKNKQLGKKGGVGGINAESIGVLMGDVHNEGVKNEGGVVMGHAHGTATGAVQITGSTHTTYNDGRSPPKKSGNNDTQ